MNNKAVICSIHHIRKHPNADRVQLGTACGYQVVIGLDVKDGDLGIYFPTDTCLGNDYANANPNLLTYFGNNLRVKTQAFRGERSEGFWTPVSTLSFLPVTNWIKGTELDTIHGKEICKKYINPETLKRTTRATNIAKKLRAGSLKTFQKHMETEHLRKEIDTLDLEKYPWYLTYKVHGTSQRVGYVLVDRELKWYEKLLKKIGVAVKETDYEFLVGTRNVILGQLRPDGTTGKDGFYSNYFRLSASKPFLGTLHKGETIYYEVVGYTGYNSPIMAAVSVKDKDLKELYGDSVTYTYGCVNGSFDIYVYRISYQTEEGVSVDLTWDKVKERCNELGVKHVPEVPKELINNRGYGNSFKKVLLSDITGVIDRPDPIDPRHPTEGVVLRLESSTPEFYKEKSFVFKVLEGIAKDVGIVDLEDAS